MLELGIGDLDQRGLGAEGDAEPSLLDHQLVVGAVADRQNIVGAQAELVAGLDQGIALGHGIDDRVADFALSFPPAKIRRLALTRSKPTLRATGSAKDRKPPDTSRQLEPPARIVWTRSGAGGQMHPLVEAAGKVALIETGEQAHPFA